MIGSVLIVEDEPELAELIQLYLRNEGIISTTVHSAEEALDALQPREAASAPPFDLVILDINLPGMDGFEFLQHFRLRYTTPVMIVSAREADEDIVMGLGIGADEFVTKPFTPRVLAARVRAHLRRSRVAQTESPSAPAAEVYRFGPFELEYESYRLRREGQVVPISPREFEVLRFLLRHAGDFFSAEELYSAVWGQNYGEPMAVPVYIQRLRKKIEADHRNPACIVTVHGKGYRFDPEALA